MKKLISIFILLIINIFIFTGCTHSESSVSPPPDEMARLQSVSVMECFENEDIEGLKSMFCKRVIDNIDLNSQIEGAFEFVNGKIISYDEPDGTSGGGLIKDGIRVELILRGDTENIKTDLESTYTLSFHSYGIYEEDTNKVGITYLRVIDENNTFYQIGEIIR